MNTLEQLKEREKEAIKTLSNVKKEIRDYWLSYHKEKYGIDIGVEVVLKDGSSAITDHVEGKDSYGKPWIKGRVRNKNGEFGKLSKNLYSYWEVLET